jgi:cysteine desulfurase
LTAAERLYLDHAATTPVLAPARAAMAETLAAWANPSSPHADGRKARASLEAMRRTVAAALDWRHDVIFTSGASEAIHIAASRVRSPRRILGPTEHDAVVSAMGEDASVLSVGDDGIVDLDSLDRALAEGPALVAVQQANNETGVLQPLEEIASRVRAAGSLLLADCAQGAGKLPLPDADFIAVSAHKLGGPPGVGALLVKNVATLNATGGQERGYRRGTENLPGIAGLAAALDSRAFMDAMPRLTDLRRTLEGVLDAAGATIVARNSPRIATIGAYALPGVASASQLVQLDLAGISVSAGSACSSASMKPSRVLEAMGIQDDVSGCVIRVSFGPETEDPDIHRFLSAWRGVADRAKARAA